MQVKSRAKIMTTKIEPTGFSLPHTYFIKHLVGVTENHPQEYDESPKNSSLRSSGSRTISVSRTCYKSSKKMRHTTETAVGTSKMTDVHKCENEGS
jgi:hypothetical protein